MHKACHLERKDPAYLHKLLFRSSQQGYYVTSKRTTFLVHDPLDDVTVVRQELNWSGK